MALAADEIELVLPNLDAGVGARSPGRSGGHLCPANAVAGRPNVVQELVVGSFRGDAGRPAEDPELVLVNRDGRALARGPGGVPDVWPGHAVRGRPDDIRESAVFEVATRELHSANQPEFVAEKGIVRAQAPRPVGLVVPRVGESVGGEQEWLSFVIQMLPPKATIGSSACGHLPSSHSLAKTARPGFSTTRQQPAELADVQVAVASGGAVPVVVAVGIGVVPARPSSLPQPIATRRLIASSPRAAIRRDFSPRTAEQPTNRLCRGISLIWRAAWLSSRVHKCLARFLATLGPPHRDALRWSGHTGPRRQACGFPDRLESSGRSRFDNFIPAGVGTTLVTRKPADSISSRYSRSVRSQPPVISSMLMSEAMSNCS